MNYEKFKRALDKRDAQQYTWDAFIAALAKAGLSQRKFAIETDTHLSVVNRWQHRVHGVPKWVPLWLAVRPAPKKVSRARKETHRSSRASRAASS